MRWLSVLWGGYTCCCGPNMHNTNTRRRKHLKTNVCGEGDVKKHKLIVDMRTNSYRVELMIEYPNKKATINVIIKV